MYRVFGIMEAMLSFLRRQVGLRTDVGDYAGTVHAKLKLLNGDITGLYGSVRPGTSDLVISSNTSWSFNLYRYNNVTINSGVTLSVASNSRGFILVCNTLTVNGLISASGRGARGGAAVSQSSPGTTNGNAGTSVPESISVGGGGGGGGGIDFSLGSGGIECTGGNGGSTAVAAGGNGGSVSGANGANGQSSNALSIVNFPWYLAASSVLIGAGGGSGSAGATDYTGARSGAGGAGGGFLIVVAKSLSIGTSGAIRADGLNGSNASYSSSKEGGAGGGGGGGGGTVIISCGDLTNNGTISASGGQWGNGTGTGSGYVFGRGGNGGTGCLLISLW